MPITVVVADDHNLVLQGIVAFLSLDPTIQVVGSANNGLTAISQVKLHKPDVLLLDLIMPEMDGFQVLQTVRREFPDTAVLILTGLCEEEIIIRAMQEGAQGYLLKTMDASQLCNTIKATASGQLILAPDAANTLIRGESRPTIEALPPHVSSIPEKLTDREIQVLKMVAQGKANKEIAYVLNLSEKTIKFHVSIILAKFGMQSRTQAAVYAANAGFIDMVEDAGELTSFTG